MAAASNPAPLPSHSPRSSDAAALNSPKSRRSAAPRAVSPWTQIVRGSDSDSIVSSPSYSSVPADTGGAALSSPSSSAAVQETVVNSSSDCSPSKSAATSPVLDVAVGDAHPESSDNASGSSNAAKKPAWNKPSNGAVEVGRVMGAVSWPALSESTRASPKSSSSDSLKALSDVSSSLSQGTGVSSSSAHKQVTNNNTTPNSTTNHVAPSRQRSMKRVGGNSNNTISANGGFPQPPPPPPGSVMEMPSNNSGKPSSTAAESSLRDHTHKDVGQRGVSHSGNDHQLQRNSFRRGNGGPHPRSDGSYHHGYGGRRDQDGGNQDWNPPRSFSGRDAHLQPPRAFPRSGFPRRGPHTSAPFIAPPPPPVPVPVPVPVPLHVRAFSNPMAYPEVMYVSADSLRAVPFVAAMPPQPVYLPMPDPPMPDPQLHTKIMNQIEYYFSSDNLIKDTFLRQNMDGQGWVPIKLIAGFKKVMELTDNIQLILDAVRTSTVVEVQNDKVRRRNDWMKWILSPSVQFSTVSSPQSLGRSSHEMLAVHIQNVALDEKNTKHGQHDVFLSRSSSGELNSQSQQSGCEDAGGATAQVGFERSTAAGRSSK